MFRRKCFKLRFRPYTLTALVALVGAAVLLGIRSLSAQDDPLAALKTAVAAVEAKQDDAAIAALKPLGARLPKIADYVAWFLASAQFDAGDYENVARTLEPVFAQAPVSPLRGRAALLAAQALENAGHASQAVALLNKYRGVLAQPKGDLENAKAALAAEDGVGAAVFAQRVYYGYPTSSEAKEAQVLIATLQTSLADRYPPVLTSTTLSRVSKLLAAGEFTRPRRELLTMEPQLSGAELETAQVKLGVAAYLARNTLAAQQYLKALKLRSPGPDAERLYYLYLCARRTGDHEKSETLLAELTRLYPTSPFRLDALINSASSFLVDNRPDDYEPLYRACYQSFPKDSKAADCHWKVAWAHYFQRREDAGDLLREQVKLFPESDGATAALYYLARLAEAAGDHPTAVAYDWEIARRYPNRYYGMLSRTHLEDGGLSGAIVNSAAVLSAFPATPAGRKRNFEPNAAALLRIDRARLLALAGLDEWWEVELRFAAQTEDQPHVVGLELARLQDRKGAPDQALHDLKLFVPDYLSLSMNGSMNGSMTGADSVPRDFWRLAFPIPYRADLDKYAAEYSIDPFLMAALVRQESEFNPKAISAANARGLTQIMPSTGRELSRRMGLKPYSLAHLFTPQVSLQMGTYYLKSIADHLGGRWEAALAAYNAGLSRANTWSTWGEFREPSEFVETVPFAQTRNYIQNIMRNADIYRRLYGTKSLARSGGAAAAPVLRLSYSQNEANTSATPAPAPH